MRLKYILFLPLLISTQFTFSLEQEEKVLGKRQASPELVAPTKKKHIFARPTYDSVFKHVLQDDETLKSLIRAFLNIDNIASITRLDEFLNPIKPHGNIRDVMNSEHVKYVMQNPAEFALYRIIQEGEEKKCDDNKKDVINELAEIYESLVSLIPRRKKDSRIDLICRLTDGKYFMLEVQVIKQRYWDERALGYAAHVYSNQLNEGEGWDKLAPVVAINILGKDKVRCWSENEDKEAIRNYTMIDEYNPKNKIKGIRILQFSLHNLDLQNLSNIKEEMRRPNLLNWLEYFKSAHKKEDIPQGIDKGLELAYKYATVKEMPELVRLAYEDRKQEQKYYARLLEEQKEEIRQKGIEEGMQKGIEEGMQKGIEEGEQKQMRKTAKKMLDKGSKLEDIAEVLDISIDALKALISE